MAENTTVIDDPGTTDTPEIKAEAKEYGWVEKEQFRGDEKDWVPAHEFVRRGRNSIPILRSKVSSLASQLNKQRQDFAQLSADAQIAKDVGYRLAAQEWQEKYEALKEQKVKAREDSDASMEVEIDEQIAEHKAAKPQKPTATSSAPNISAEEQAWLAQNPWYTANVKLQAAANAYGATIAQAAKAEGKPLNGAEILAEVAKHMREAYPQETLADGEFATASATTHTGSRRQAADNTNTKAKTYDNLPAEAKAACDRGVKAKRFTREEYVNTYQWD